jgi:hypothetical protein
MPSCNPTATRSQKIALLALRCGWLHPLRLLHQKKFDGALRGSRGIKQIKVNQATSSHIKPLKKSPKHVEALKRQKTAWRVRPCHKTHPKTGNMPVENRK